jgi:hypothetical protein
MGDLHTSASKSIIKDYAERLLFTGKSPFYKNALLALMLIIWKD